MLERRTAARNANRGQEQGRLGDRRGVTSQWRKRRSVERSGARWSGAEAQSGRKLVSQCWRRIARRTGELDLLQTADGGADGASKHKRVAGAGEEEGASN